MRASAGTPLSGGTMNQRAYESALNDVRYTFGRPLPFVPRLPGDPRSDDPKVWRLNADRAQREGVRE
jgi:hypothetical protein